MAIEIHIMSGARQGERVELDVDELLVGGDPTCDVSFELDHHVRSARVQIRHDDEGYRIRNLGGGQPLVNQELLETSLPLRSGDVVRLSDLGPDFRFLIKAARSDKAAPVAEVPDASHRPTDLETPQAAGTAPATATGGSALADFWRRHGLLVIFGIAAVLVLLLIVVLVVTLILAVTLGTTSREQSQVQTGDDSRVVSTESRDPGGTAPAPRPEKAAGVVGPDSVADRPEESPVVHPAPGESPPAPGRSDGPGIMPDPGRPEPGSTAAVDPPPPGESPIVILAAGSNDQRDQLEPFAVACAIEYGGRQLVLTTAHLAFEMVRLRAEKQLRIEYFAIALGGNGQRAAVMGIDPGAIYLDRGYAIAMELDDFESAEYYDVGLLFCRGKLPVSCPVAESRVIDTISEDVRLVCWADYGPWRPIRRQAGGPAELPSTWLEDMTRSAIVKRRRPLVDARDARALFEFSITSGRCMEGSPLVNHEGEVVGVCTRAVGPGKAGQRAMAAAAPISEEMVAALWEDTEEKRWLCYREGDDGQQPPD